MTERMGETVRMKTGLKSLHYVQIYGAGSKTKIMKQLKEEFAQRGSHREQHQSVYCHDVDVVTMGC